VLFPKLCGAEQEFQLPNERRLRSIDGFYKSYAMELPSQAKAAIVFVHGFAGSPTGTWCDFHHLSEEYAPDYPWWKDLDLFFYKYDSTRKPILYNAVRFRTFLMQTLSGSSDESVGYQTEIKWKYAKLLLVGHSEGAVVIRRMVLDRIEAIEKLGRKRGLDGQPLASWIDQESTRDLIFNARLYLFAPACAGTNFSGLLGFVDSVSSLFSAIASSSVVRNELVKNSPILTGLQTGTEAAHKDHRAIAVFSAEILFGTDDHVVYVDKYGCDEIVEPYAEDHNHVSVCKPRYIYKRPLEFVKL
jgi:pimeloyl-ACP methyl ester carboxylesterase